MTPNVQIAVGSVVWIASVVLAVALAGALIGGALVGSGLYRT